MVYKYKKPEKVSFQEFTKEFIPAFDQADEVAKQKALTLNVWAYGICVPGGTPPHPYFVYNGPGCIPS